MWLKFKPYIDKFLRNALNARMSPRPIVKYAAAWLFTCYPAWNFLHIGKLMLAAFVLAAVVVVIKYVGLRLKVVPRETPVERPLHETINSR